MWVPVLAWVPVLLPPSVSAGLTSNGVAKAVTVEPPPGAPAEPKRSVAPACVLGALAAGGIGSGIVFSALLAWKNSDAAAAHAMIVAHHGNCIPGTAGYDPTCAALVAAGNAADLWYDAAVGAFVAGGVSAAGTALYLLWPSLQPKTDLRLMPILGTQHGVLLSGSF
jgi:hypothetical protein